MSRDTALVSADWAEKNLDAPGVVFVEVDDAAVARGDSQHRADSKYEPHHFFRTLQQSPKRSPIRAATRTGPATSIATRPRRSPSSRSARA